VRSAHGATSLRGKEVAPRRARPEVGRRPSSVRIRPLSRHSPLPLVPAKAGIQHRAAAVSGRSRSYGRCQNGSCALNVNSALDARRRGHERSVRDIQGVAPSALRLCPPYGLAPNDDLAAGAAQSLCPLPWRKRAHAATSSPAAGPASTTCHGVAPWARRLRPANG
jgi:hypothetical protein